MQKPLQVAICEDFLADTTLLHSLVKQSGVLAVCELFDSGEDFLRGFCTGQYELVFIDVYMSGMRGIEVVEHIRETDENVVIAFTTTSLYHTLESYRLGVLKYIEKPVTQKAVRETMELALLKRKTRAFITLIIRGENEEIPLDSILHFEQQDHVLLVNTSDRVLQTSQSIKMASIETQLPSPPFLRCHHSYIVNLRYVKSMDKELRTFTMKNGNKAHIRREDLKKAKDAYETYLFATTRGEDY